jgi:hypothetical protein
MSVRERVKGWNQYSLGQTFLSHELCVFGPLKLPEAKEDRKLCVVRLALFATFSAKHVHACGFVIIFRNDAARDPSVINVLGNALPEQQYMFAPRVGVNFVLNAA